MELYAQLDQARERLASLDRQGAEIERSSPHDHEAKARNSEEYFQARTEMQRIFLRLWPDSHYVPNVP